MARAPESAASTLRAELAGLDREPLAGASGASVSRRRAVAVDRALPALFPHSDRLALVGVGGYGRSQLSPGSDIDLMIIHEAGAHAEAEEAFARVLYPLWDLGLSVGHAVRTPDECLAEARRRLDSMTAFLDGRLLAGSPNLFEQAHGSVLQSVRADPGWLLEELRASMVQREAKFGALGEILEPNLRDSVGGLRDAQALGWVARGLVDGQEADLLVRGLLREGELAAATEATDLLLLARTALHRIVGRREDRLQPEHQGPVASALGFEDGPSAPPVVWEARDVLMRRLFLLGRAVRAAAEATLRRAGADHLGHRRHLVSVDWDRPIPEAVLVGFAHVAEAGADLTVEDLDRIESTAGSGWDRSTQWTGPMLPALVEILAAGDGGARALSLLDVLGVLTMLIPEWDHVRGRPQRDPFHRVPADTHLVRTAAHLARMLFRPDDPLAARSAAQVRDPGPLLIAALLHDIGKVGAGGHVEHGARAAEAITARMGLPREQGDLVTFLVREHLLLSDTATRRNLEDQDLILHVAARVGTAGQLAALYLLTIADAESTGPTAATPWRLGLIRELVGLVGRAFERGEMSPDRAAELDRAQREIRAALSHVGGEIVERFLAPLPSAYLGWVDPADTPVHLSLILPRPGRHEARTHHRAGRSAGLHLLTVGAVDQPGLLASIAGALTLAGFTVLSAQAFTTEDGVALDAFEVAGAFEPEVTEDRWRRFRTTLRHALEGRVDVADQIQSMRAHYRAAPKDVQVTVRIDQEASDFFTVVEVGASDRRGLLFDLARTLADHGLDVHLAKVATYGPRVVDVFYVAQAGGGKVSATRAAGLEEALRRAAGAVMPASAP